LASEPATAIAIAGRWHPPSSSRSVDAVLEVDADGIVSVEDAQGRAIAEATLVSVEVSPRVGSIPRRISFGDGSVFETADNDGVDRALRRLRRRGAGLVHELERFRPRLALFALVVIALAAMIYRFAVPVLVEVAIAATPPVVPRLLSQSAMISLDQTVFSESRLDAATRGEIADGFAGLAALADDDATRFRLNFRDGGAIGANAFALPDGTIVLTDELVTMMGEDHEAVLGVLAHEIGHVKREHSLRQLYRAAGVSGLVLLIGGDIGGGAEDVLIQGAALVSLSYSRGQEAEADRFSVELMHEAGRDPAAIARFFEKMRNEMHDTGEGDFFSSHPATQQRIEETRRYAGEVAGND
jgi:predicted Zn-dependent protease